MPIFNLICPQCARRTRKLIANPENQDKMPCPDCDGTLVRDGEGPTTRVVEVRDNGLMPKKVEQLADVQELIQQRSTKPDEPGKV